MPNSREIRIMFPDRYQRFDVVYGIEAADPMTLFSTAAGMLGMGLGAAMLPAIRAGRIAPATALRID